MNASKEEKRACPFSSLTPSRQKKTTKSFCRQRVGFEISRERQGSYYNQENWLKDDKAPKKPIKTTAELISKRSELFRPRSSQARVTRRPAPYKNRMKYCFESLL